MASGIISMKNFNVRLISAAIAAPVLLVGAVVFFSQNSSSQNNKSAELVTASPDSTTATATTLPLTCANGGVCKVDDIGPGGGTIFYDAGSPQPWGQYLEVSPPDAQTKAAWGCPQTLISGTLSDIGAGRDNTNKIIAKCADTRSAAQLAHAYSTTSTQAGDWFLPSRDELNLLCLKYSTGRTDTTKDKKHQTGGCTGNKTPTGGFVSGDYWSSFEDHADDARGQLFNDGVQYDGLKTNIYNVRPIRAF